jgi:methylmalonyl-CoA/ethylmalonyl-CoA epimerase
MQNVSVAFVDVGGVRIELIEPAAADSPVSLSLDKGQPLVHLCFEVDNLDAAATAARAAGFHQIAKPVPAPALASRRIAWLYSRTYGLMELLERQA